MNDYLIVLKGFALIAWNFSPVMVTVALMSFTYWRHDRAHS